MPYADFGSFRPDYEAAQLGAQAVHGINNATKPVDPAVAWPLYQHARSPALGFHVFGRHVTGTKAKALQDHRTKKGNAAALPKHMQGITKSGLDKFEQNFGYVNEVGDGSILMMGGGKWNFTVNDSWLLGGVHSHMAFYAASVISKDNILDDTYVLSITGRELLGLALYGYKEVHNHKALGVVYVCDDTAKADAATLSDFQTQVAGAIKSKKAAVAAFKAAGIKLS